MRKTSAQRRRMERRFTGVLLLAQTLHPDQDLDVDVSWPHLHGDTLASGCHFQFCYPAEPTASFRPHRGGNEPKGAFEVTLVPPGPQREDDSLRGGRALRQ